MIVRIISRQSYDMELYPETLGRPYFDYDSKNFSKEQWELLMAHWKLNHSYKLLDYQIICK